MRVILTAKAEKQLRRLPKFEQLIIARKIRWLGSQIFLGEEKLKGTVGAYRVRVGDYRIVYRKTKQVIYVVLIGHRREIYRMWQNWVS
ncbi:hypothetical protein A2W24_03265 [Microgenomates group bacterium RBG_16_45_19]|nr:MAG: hypothetical protein A2W24_03265 [Microgenomates group bacterium RBG_16_45_19]